MGLVTGFPHGLDVQHQKRFPRERSPATARLVSVEPCSSETRACQLGPQATYLGFPLVPFRLLQTLRQIQEFRAGWM